MGGAGADPAGRSDGLTALSGIYHAMNGILNDTYYLSLQFILFILDVMIGFPLTDSIARSLGGSISLSLGGKLKLA